MFHALDVSTSALLAQRSRMDVIAGNIAHSNTTQSEDGKIEPFQRRLTIMQAAAVPGGPATGGLGVTSEVQIDRDSPTRIVIDPGHPHANEKGEVHYPNINVVTEFVNALEASRAYEANVNTMQMTREMIQSTFQIIA